jgi:hypothetical protein
LAFALTPIAASSVGPAIGASPIRSASPVILAAIIAGPPIIILARHTQTPCSVRDLGQS